MVNVTTQVQTLIRHRVMGAAIAAGKVRVIGLFFDIPTARVFQVDSQSVAKLDPAALATAGSRLPSPSSVTTDMSVIPAAALGGTHG